MQTLFEKLLFTIKRRWINTEVKSYTEIEGFSAKTRLIINSSPAKAVQLCFEDNICVQIDILPEYFPSKDEYYNLYAQFNNNGHTFTNVGGQCFIFDREKVLYCLQGEEAIESETCRNCSEDEFIVLVMKTIDG